MLAASTNAKFEVSFTGHNCCILCIERCASLLREYLVCRLRPAERYVLFS